MLVRILSLTGGAVDCYLNATIGARHDLDRRSGGADRFMGAQRQAQITVLDIHPCDAACMHHADEGVDERGQLAEVGRCRIVLCLLGYPARRLVAAHARLPLRSPSAR